MTRWLVLATLISGAAAHADLYQELAGADGRASDAGVRFDERYAYGVGFAELGCQPGQARMVAAERARALLSIALGASVVSDQTTTTWGASRESPLSTSQVRSVLVSAPMLAAAKTELVATSAVGAGIAVLVRAPREAASARTQAEPTTFTFTRRELARPQLGPTTSTSATLTLPMAPGFHVSVLSTANGQASEAASSALVEGACDVHAPEKPGPLPAWLASDAKTEQRPPPLIASSLFAVGEALFTVGQGLRLDRTAHPNPFAPVPLRITQLVSAGGVVTATAAASSAAP